MHKPNFTDDTSIELSFGIPRKFRSKKINEIIDEVSLLKLNDNLLLLGDPGAGKTTTLKRLARRLLIEEPIYENDYYHFPILIKLRDIKYPEKVPETIYNNEKNNPVVIKQKVCAISQEISRILGLKIREEKNEREEIKDDKVIKTINIKYYIGDDFVDTAICKILNNIKIVVMIDGLDELPLSIRDSYEESIVGLADKLRESTILLTCRSGGYINKLDGFSFYEIRPLDKGQINHVIHKWANDPKSFQTALSRVPYADMANRPLFLNQLIISYNYYGSLPGQPFEIYKRIIHLMLVKWDKDRKIERSSVYSDFHPDKKIKFLSAIAYELTYIIQSKIFTKEQLAKSYRQVCSRFFLPIDEAYQVAQEIESHTGIITKSTDNNYEFSHLSLQEYLCADFIVHDPTMDTIPKYLRLYPPPVSIAIALSSRPEKLLSEICLNIELHTLAIPNKSFKVMMSRLLIESPGFSESLELGIAFFKLMAMALKDREFEDCIAIYFQLAAIKKSLSMALPYFQVRKMSTEKHFKLEKKLTVPHLNYPVPPHGEYISAYLIQKLKSECSIIVHPI